MLSGIATDSDNLVEPDSEKKLFCVKCGLRTKSCTQIESHSDFFATSCRTMDHESRQLEHPKQQNLLGEIKQLMEVRTACWLDTVHTIYRCWRAQKPTCAEQNVRTSPTLGRLLVDDRSSCRCSRKKDWYSALYASISLPLVQPFSNRPSNSLKSCKGATSYPPITIAGQKELRTCRIFDLEATVNRTLFTNSLGNRPASLRKPFRRYWLPTLSNTAITRVPERKSFLSIAGNRKWFGTTYSSHCSTRGNDEAFSIFCSKQ